MAALSTHSTGARAPGQLLAQVRGALRVRHYSVRTQGAYLGWVRRFVRFHGVRHPVELGGPDISRFLTCWPRKAA